VKLGDHLATDFTKQSCQYFAIISPPICGAAAGHLEAMTPSHDHTAAKLDQREAELTESQRRAQVEAALRESEERYRELFENSRDAIYIHDMNGRYTSVNRAAEGLTGYSREEILGKHYSNFVRPTYLKTVRENFCRKLDVPLETTYETEVACKDGTRKPVEVTSRMIYRNGEPAGVQGTVRDISERKRAQRALQTYSRRLVNAQEAERENIVRELHDNIGQSLKAISLNLKAIQTSGEVNESARSRLGETIDVLELVLRRVRELSSELRPANQDEPGSVKDGLLYQPAVNI
jgi:PAS domain S-box-containing protein